MLQLTQKLKDGSMEVKEVAHPILEMGTVIVQNHFSVVSSGTESSTISAARKGLIGKAKERPQQAKQVLDMLLQQGPVQTYRTVMKKLDAWSPLGYSSAGEVIEVGSGVKGFAVGDRVACAGSGFANHAEIISVPMNLCVKLPDNADLRRAAYNTLGAIALQGIRQADLRINETGAVIGLGLIGQLTCLLLRASGVRVVGIDIDPSAVSTARRHCVDEAFLRTDSGIVDQIVAFTHGLGVDATIIAAATTSLDPVNFAGEIARKKGRVVVVGNVPTGFAREPHYYRKELELRMSCSYGPGRYDPDYEEKGIDYPAGYVRWTEGRNMEAFQDLVHSGKINIDYLTTHIFKLEDAPKAYDLIFNKTEPHLGILIEYDFSRDELSKKIFVAPHTSHLTPNAINIAFVGAGSYAQSHLLPNIRKDKDILLRGVMTSSGTTSRTVAEKFRFEFCTSNGSDILNNKDINTVFITTRHNTHADYVIKALQAGKNVYVEKPLCLNETELEEIFNTYNSSLNTHHSSLPLLMVGFNRRFSPLTVLLKEKFGSGAMSMIYRINAGAIPADSWIQDQEIGGGRIIGEVCHFIDFLTFINGSLPDKVFATALPDPGSKEDTVNISLSFKNGSIGTISYFSNGSKSLFKEYVEVYKAGVTAILKDFKELGIYGGARRFKKSLFSQDKGQRTMVKAFLDSVRNGKPSPISFEEIHAVTLTTFKIIESIRTRNGMAI
ncbi:MAG: bi-domain-containing oxidoreductase [Deltaproteobacteria bacterium]|nr:bi-domain-containing oxidoreductase [Deltaproteobacteria bacterium]